MNFRQIRYFCEVVEAGSAAHAAERLFIAPTAISMQLAQLESHLGGELFDRSRRPMELTSLGKFFYPRAKELLMQAERLDSQAHGVASGGYGWLAIGFARAMTFAVLPDAIRTFRASFPEIQLDLVEALSEYQLAHLRQGRIDIGLSRYIGDFDMPDDLVAAVTLADPLMAAVPLHHPLAGQPSLTAAELSTLPFILYPKDPRSLFGQQVMSILRDAGARPVVAYEAIEIYTALSLVGAGLGATLVGKSTTENNRSDVVFIPVSDIAGGTNIVAITRAGETSKPAAAFLTILEQQSRK
jgi:LysR family transcriptional regulator, benzoate and cis,cis-muconate-responsive activator of ben and cat genes